MFLHSGQKRKSSGTAWFVETCSCNKFEHIAANTHKHTCPAALVHVVSCRPNHSFMFAAKAITQHRCRLKACCDVAHWQSVFQHGTDWVFTDWDSKIQVLFEGTADLIRMEEVGFHVISKHFFTNLRNRKKVDNENLEQEIPTRSYARGMLGKRSQ